MGIKACPRCGERLNDNVSVCPICGWDFEWEYSRKDYNKDYNFFSTYKYGNYSYKHNSNNYSQKRQNNSFYKNNFGNFNKDKVDLKIISFFKESDDRNLIGLFPDFEYKSQIENYPIYSLSTYYPKNSFSDDMLEDKERIFRNYIYKFKDGEEKISKFFCEILSDLILKNNLVKSFDKTILCVIPASKKTVTELRYKTFVETLSEKLGIENGYSCIVNFKDRPSKHNSNFKANILDYLRFDSEKIREKEVILLDDIITTGNSFYSIAKVLTQLGAKSVTGIFLGKTINTINSWNRNFAENHNHRFLSEVNLKDNELKSKNIRFEYDSASYISYALRDILEQKYNMINNFTFKILRKYEKQSVKDTPLVLVAKIFNNIVSRGIPTFNSNYLDENILNLMKDYITYEKNTETGSINYLIEFKDKNKFLEVIDEYLIELKQRKVSKDNFLAINILSSWLHKALIYAIVDGILTSDKSWNIAIIEKDAKFSEIAMIDAYIYMSEISRLLNFNMPEIQIEIFREDINKKYEKELNGIKITYQNFKNYDNKYDLTINIGYSLEENFQEIKSPHIIIRPEISNNVYLSFPRFLSFTPQRFDIDNEKEKSLKFILQNVFKKVDFRDGQIPIIRRTLSLKSTIGLLPTGAGKSLCYQLSGLLQPGVVIIIDPIKSLMFDQVYNLESIGINSSKYINSDLSLKEKEFILEDLKRGNFKFVFIAPERLQIKSFRKNLKKLTETFPVPFVVIDEAHCVSEWGHEFRTSYLNVARIVKKVAKHKDYTPPIIALTGTASYAVLNDIQKELGIDSNSAKIYPKSFDREELNFYVIRTVDKKIVLKEILLKKLSELLNTDNIFKLDGNNTKCGIIFTSTVNGEMGVLAVSRYLKQLGINSKIFSGGKPKGILISDYESYKLKVQEEFKNNEFAILVSTKAFGMGVDKPNIRYTIHYSLPSSLEAFYQEAGRAGRDRNSAHCFLIFTEQSKKITDLVLDTTRSNDEVQSVYKKVSSNINDDISTQMYFHFGSFQGEENERNMLKNLVDLLISYIERLKDNETAFLKIASLDKKKVQNLEKAIYRLTILGIIDDYTIEYRSSKIYEIKLKKLNFEEIKQNFASYLKRYKTSRYINNLIEKNFKGEYSLKGFIYKVISVLINFVYSEIEKQRRRALYTMVEVARKSKTNEDVKKYILNYFNESVYSKDLMKLVHEFNSRDLLDFINEFEYEEIEDVENIYGNIQRFLESYPDNPSLYLLSTFSRIILNHSRTEIMNDWKNFLEYLKENVISKEELDEIVGNAFEKIMKFNITEELKHDIYEALCTKFYVKEIMLKYYHLNLKLSYKVVLENILNNLRKIDDNLKGGKNNG